MWIKSRWSCETVFGHNKKKIHQCKWSYLEVSFELIWISSDCVRTDDSARKQKVADLPTAYRRNVGGKELAKSASP